MKQILILISVIYAGSTKSKPEDEVDENSHTPETEIEFPKAKPLYTFQELMTSILEEYNIDSQNESDELQSNGSFDHLPKINLLHHRVIDDLTSHEQTINSKMNKKILEEKSQSIPTNGDIYNSQGVENKPHNHTASGVKDSSKDKHLAKNNQRQKHKRKVFSDGKQDNYLKIAENTNLETVPIKTEKLIHTKKLSPNRKDLVAKRTSSSLTKKLYKPKAKKLSQKRSQKHSKKTKDEDYKESRHKKKSKSDKLKKSKKSPKSKSKDNTLEHTPSTDELTQGDDPNAYLTLNESENIQPNSDLKIDSDKSLKVKTENDDVESEINVIDVKAVGGKPIDDDDSKAVSKKPQAVTDSIQSSKSQTSIHITQSAQPHNIITLTFNISRTKIIHKGT